MKHLKKFEALRFEFDDIEKEYLKSEEMEIMDRRNLFLDFEEDYLYKVGFEYREAERAFFGEENGFLAKISKYYRNSAPSYVFYVYRIRGQEMSTLYESFISLEQASTENQRINLLKRIVRQIYVILNMDKKAEERKLRRQSAAIERPERPNIAGMNPNDWWNVEKDIDEGG